MKLFRILLKTKPYEIIEAWNGQEGVEKARTLKPQLILMDIQLLILDGIQAFQQIRADPLTHAIPVIALTSYVIKEDDEKLLGLGFNGYIANLIIKAILLHEIALFI